MNARKRRVRRFCFWLFLAAWFVAVFGRESLHPKPEWPERHSNRGLNAAWLGVEWVNGDRSINNTIILADELARREIKYVFVFVSYLKPDSEFNPTYSHAVNFVRALKDTNPHLNVQAWIGLPLASPFGSGYVDLKNAAIRSEIVSFCIDMVRKFGFDGIHLDPEPVVNGDTSLLALLEELRFWVGSDASISLSTRRVWPASNINPPFVSQFAWQVDYYQEISQRVDQIAVMTYDSGLPLSALFRRWVSMQVVQLSRALDGVPVELFVGVPTSEEWTLTHWPNAENITSGLQGVVDGLSNPSARPSVVSGVAIYPYWEMDADEWASYESLWLNR